MYAKLKGFEHSTTSVDVTKYSQSEQTGGVAQVMNPIIK